MTESPIDKCTACADAEGYCPRHDPHNEVPIPMSLIEKIQSIDPEKWEGVDANFAVEDVCQDIINLIRQHITLRGEVLADAYMEGFSDGLSSAGSEFCDYRQEAVDGWKFSSARKAAIAAMNMGVAPSGSPGGETTTAVATPASEVTYSYKAADEAAMTAAHANMPRYDEKGRYQGGAYTLSDESSEICVSTAPQKAQSIIETIWAGWYGKHRGVMNSDQFSMLLAGAKEDIVMAINEAAPEPVSVSLEKCTRACMEADYKAFQNTHYARKYDQRNLGERYKEVAKAVLDAAGVAYVS